MTTTAADFYDFACVVPPGGTLYARATTKTKFRPTRFQLYTPHNDMVMSDVRLGGRFQHPTHEYLAKAAEEPIIVIWDDVPPGTLMELGVLNHTMHFRAFAARLYGFQL